MAHRGNDSNQRAGNYQKRVVEVVLMKTNLGSPEHAVAVLTVENDVETLSFVRDNMENIAANMAGVKRMEAATSSRVEENAQLFQNHLEPLFALISATATDHVLDKLSASLRKALLLMAIDRYDCDCDSICRALGLTRGKLEKELKKCGLVPPDRKAA